MRMPIDVKKTFAITFYGGEPLLNFKVMKQCIEYCLKEYSEVETSFGFTTNLTLMTEEIADYLAKVPNLSMVVSLDGPEEIHNQNRTFANGAPSFDATYRGLQYLCNAIRRHGHIELMINSVLMPPYTAERFSKINDFFESLTFMPKNSMVSATYPVAGSVPDSFIENLVKQGYDETQDINWVDWSEKRIRFLEKLPESPNLYSDIMRKFIGSIHNRRLVEEPLDRYFWNACCNPGNRRLYVCTDGTYKVCEKIGNAPPLGDVDTGLDFDAIKEKYFDEYEKVSMGDCSTCWALNLCDICYAECYCERGVDIERKRRQCVDTRRTALKKLSLYHEILETNPSIIEQVSKLERS